MAGDRIKKVPSESAQLDLVAWLKRRTGRSFERTVEFVQALVSSRKATNERLEEDHGD